MKAIAIILSLLAAEQEMKPQENFTQVKQPTCWQQQWGQRCVVPWNQPYLGWGCNGWYASTAAEGYLSGAARLAQAKGLYLESLGKFYISREQAKKMDIDNWSHKVRTRRQLLDEYKERVHNEHPTAADLLEKKLDAAERMAALRAREDKLIASGVLPPKKEPKFGFGGKTYRDFNEFKQSLEYVIWKHELAVERAKEEARILAKNRAEAEILAKQRERRLRNTPFYLLSDYERQRLLQILAE